MNQSDLNFVKQAEAAAYVPSILSSLTADTSSIPDIYLPY